MSIDNCRARNWCFTLNNYTQEEFDEAEKLGTKTNYIIVGKEVGSNSTPHLQGYLEYPNAVRGSAIRKLFGGRAHWEVRKGTPKQASEYCKKEKDFFEIGTLSAQGTRTDLDEISSAVLAGASFQEIATTFPGTYIKYHKGIAALKDAAEGRLDLKPRDPNKPPCVIWRWGLAGVGKTRHIYDKHKSIFLQKGTKWWDGYSQQEAIIIDDFDGRWPYRDLLKVLDRYPLRVEIKGGTMELNSPFIYITCEHPPSWFWGLTAKYRNNNDAPPSENELEQIMRRIVQGGGSVTEVVTQVWVVAEETKTG
nr:putative replication associated protein [Crucivirus sp.]